jgi:hypothetical protein
MGVPAVMGAIHVVAPILDQVCGGLASTIRCELWARCWVLDMLRGRRVRSHGT